MQIALPLEFTYIIIIIAFPLILLGFYFYFKRDHKSIEFKVASMVIGLMMIMFILLVLAVGTFNSELIPYFIILPIGAGLIVFTVYLITARIRTNKEILSNVLSSGKQIEQNPIWLKRFLLNIIKTNQNRPKIWKLRSKHSLKALQIN